MPNQASDFDEKFGILRLPSNVHEWEKNNPPISLELLTSEVGERLKALKYASNSKLLKFAATCSNFIWCVDGDGQFWIAYEEIVPPIGSKQNDFHSGYPRRRNFPEHPSEEVKLGHPSLINCGEARIAGELFLDENEDGNLEWYANAFSGRYCRTHKPSEEHCNSAHEVLRALIDPNLIWDNGS